MNLYLLFLHDLTSLAPDSLPKEGALLPKKSAAMLHAYPDMRTLVRSWSSTV